MGSPDFALSTLQALHENYPVVGVVTQPDRAAGRGRELKQPPVKMLALELGIPVIQPEKLREPEAMEQLRAWAPDVIVVAAFGQILKQDVLDLPKFGCINVHASLLPRWRGAAPINAAILHGDEETGITIMKMDAGLDTGPILSQRSVRIQPDETAGSLFETLSLLGSRSAARNPARIYHWGNHAPSAAGRRRNLCGHAEKAGRRTGFLVVNCGVGAQSTRIQPMAGNVFRLGRG